MKIGRSLITHSSHLISAPKIECYCIREFLHKAKGETGYTLPNDRIRTRSNMCMNAYHLKTILGANCFYFLFLFVPDPERG